ncbi:MAG: hypothetical protein A2528_02685 [Candidatus Staskawiczbacteria bacterium RIFOXYD2_FULL_37_9]|uniref:Uncharacterized protein n=1 Tax=Candidatus Staskawiczbacteria bacterium RIFOXYB1_FULL_37_44 TaxID=1802223 RepID=A0A1G2IVC6_9BACT|nr:MAG: hypothetical protein A2358_03480 [Candidatus Staskawiczbacteria bacterium RIFOXYB1_FULL_37_44]OGZ88881.1 MAG: hypothetical protein A2581_00050 [Candidatus Staskawiczbacteria bacterium RIFOXYD1_FULL_37_110]OGZ94407.1 MAG: hypothetical protein A2528_02685 [Candidatus Staskawiczbacteria bacterium RIFOXYD2_FULL_37_9]
MHEFCKTVLALLYRALFYFTSHSSDKCPKCKNKKMLAACPHTRRHSIKYHVVQCPCGHKWQAPA